MGKWKSLQQQRRHLLQPGAINDESACLGSGGAWGNARTRGDIFRGGDAVRVCEGHSHYPNVRGVVTEVYEETSAAIVKLEGVRKPVVLPFVELVKITLSNGDDRRSHSRDRGSG